MVKNEFKLVNNSNNKGIKFAWANNVVDNVSINNISFNIPGGASADNFIANFGGFKRLITIDFVLQNDGTDKSIDGDNIITLSQQWDYLLDTIIQGKSGSGAYFDVLYSLTIYRDGSPNKSYTGGIDDISLIGNPATSGTLINGSLTLMVGTN